MFANKSVVLGVTGSISVYKAVDLASKLTQEGIEVHVVMTGAATKFVTPLSFRTVTHKPVVTEMFDVTSEFSVEHVALAERADVLVIAPATANIIAKMASGIADDMLSCTVLATRAPVILAPAMNVGMYENPITQENLAKLKARGFISVGPTHGRLASGAIGTGRLIENDLILSTIYQVLGKTGDLAKKQIVISAGGTQEPLDPVRYISNRSSGKMGYAVAEAARNRGAMVTLITTPTSLPLPTGVEITPVETALQMRNAILKATAQADALIMVAAVADYRPMVAAKSKIKRTSETLTLELVKTPDILSEVRNDIVKVGFAAESTNLTANAKKKVVDKKLDFIVANDITAKDSGFATDTNRVSLIDSKGKVEKLPLMLKSEVAHRILDKVVKIIA
ncbi:bifunctional phosphopantothenoylcysteine decarboxylase/phosphopantothenate--cysteine ligase CoaBC [Chloroflexota bacterium]